MLLLIFSHKILDQALFINLNLRLEHIAEVSNHRPFCLHFAFYMAIIHKKPIIRSSRIREFHLQILLPVLSKGYQHTYHFVAFTGIQLLFIQFPFF